jgi:hypothetical protein
MEQAHLEPKKKSVLEPILIVVFVIGVLVYGVITAVTGDPKWFLGGVSMPDPQRIVIRVDGEETVLTSNSIGYEIMVKATKKSLSSFQNSAPVPMGLSDDTIEEYKHRFTVVELYFDTPVDFHLAFNDMEPTALLIPIRGRHAGKNWVFRGQNDRWHPGPLTMTDPQPLFQALATLGYIESASICEEADCSVGN